MLRNLQQTTLDIGGSRGGSNDCITGKKRSYGTSYVDIINKHVSCLTSDSCSSATCTELVVYKSTCFVLL